MSDYIDYTWYIHRGLGCFIAAHPHSALERALSHEQDELLWSCLDRVKWMIATCAKDETGSCVLADGGQPIPGYCHVCDLDPCDCVGGVNDWAP